MVHRPTRGEERLASLFLVIDQALDRRVQGTDVEHFRSVRRVHGDVADTVLGQQLGEGMRRLPRLTEAAQVLAEPGQIARADRARDLHAGHVRTVEPVRQLGGHNGAGTKRDLVDHQMVRHHPERQMLARVQTDERLLTGDHRLEAERAGVRIRVELSHRSREQRQALLHRRQVGRSPLGRVPVWRCGAGRSGRRIAADDRPLV